MVKRNRRNKVCKNSRKVTTKAYFKEIFVTDYYQNVTFNYESIADSFSLPNLLSGVLWNRGFKSIPNCSK